MRCDDPIKAHPGIHHPRLLRNPGDHWFRWLAEELETAGSPTVVPAFPNPENPDRPQWLDALAAEVGISDHNTILIAHSLGCLTDLRYRSSLSEPWNLGSLVLVSGFLDPLPALLDLDEYIAGGCYVSTIGDHVELITVIRSDQDPYVPTAHTDRLAQQLGVTAHVIDGAGHFLTSDGIDTLPAILPFTAR
ncbi:RBBP9/YdeN family alpha/beta hydrolase [Rhodococcus erythropolis]|uniref:RBBP9/YdeN family alpha/beta hydrolase n=1 Tax=Rhodococcus erythropolis TaxID=1833 RepID=UPI0036DD4E60